MTENTAAATPEMLGVTSGVSTSGRPFIHVSWGDKLAQWSVEDARQFAGQCLAVAEAAEHDAIVFAWLGDKLGMTSWPARAQVLNDLRKYRQDSTTSTIAPEQTANPE